MSASVMRAARALAIGFVLAAAAGSAPAWSQGHGHGVRAPQDSYVGYCAYGGYCQGNSAQYPAAPYGGR